MFAVSTGKSACVILMLIEVLLRGSFRHNQFILAPCFENKNVIIRKTQTKAQTSTNSAQQAGRSLFGQHQESRPLGRSNADTLQFTDFPSPCTCSTSS